MASLANTYNTPQYTTVSTCSVLDAGVFVGGKHNGTLRNEAQKEWAALGDTRNERITNTNREQLMMV